MRPLTHHLEPIRAPSVERIVQLDFKLARTFRAGRWSFMPTFEVNVNNSDAIISQRDGALLAASTRRSPPSRGDGAKPSPLFFEG